MLSLRVARSLVRSSELCLGRATAAATSRVITPIQHTVATSSIRWCSSAADKPPPPPPSTSTSSPSGSSQFFTPTTSKAEWRAMAEKDINNYLQQTHDRVFEQNAKWAAEKKAADPNFFANLSAGQNPEYLWIGCSDSRIPAEQITGLEPGDAFVHRNIANLVCNTDLNAMSVITYAVEHLKVKHIVVCGHYGCGGVKAAMTPKDLGILNPWLRNIRDVYRLHEKELDAIKDEEARYNRLVELNVIEQCRNVIKIAGVQQSYAKNGFPIVHGWVFGFNDGLLKDLEIDFKGILANIQKIYNLTDS
ncbi:carbonic anhydrase [Cladorrhinum sp. PSN259]|nr:carbonic anhydrase [Cladorrhinum sp. PSN259]